MSEKPRRKLWIIETGSDDGLYWAPLGGESYLARGTQPEPLSHSMIRRLEVRSPEALAKKAHEQASRIAALEAQLAQARGTIRDLDREAERMVEERDRLRAERDEAAGLLQRLIGAHHEVRTNCRCGRCLSCAVDAFLTRIAPAKEGDESSCRHSFKTAWETVRCVRSADHDGACRFHLSPIPQAPAKEEP